MERGTSVPLAQTPSELRRLAEFVGRLYLLLVTVVFDHARWLPRHLRANYQAALLEVYPSVHELQAALLDPAPPERLLQRIREAGLVGAQLELKLDSYRFAEARFYGGSIPDRKFLGEGEFWQAPSPAEDRPPRSAEEITRGRKRWRFASLLDPVFSAANTILGSLLGVLQVSEAYKEIKEGVEFGVKNNKLIRRIGHGVGAGVNRLRKLVTRRGPEELPAAENDGESRPA